MSLITNLSLPVDVLERRFSNVEETIGSLARDRTVMLVFLRFFRCLFCREALSDLSRARAPLESKGLRIALIHQHGEGDAAEFLPKYRMDDIPRLSDPSLSLYHAFGLKRASMLSQMLKPRVVARVLSVGLRRLPGGPMAPDTDQMPGVFLVRGGRVLAGFVYDSLADRPDYLGLAGGVSGSAPGENPPN